MCKGIIILLFYSNTLPVCFPHQERQRPTLPSTATAEVNNLKRQLTALRQEKTRLRQELLTKEARLKEASRELVKQRRQQEREKKQELAEKKREAAKEARVITDLKKSLKMKEKVSTVIRVE